MKLIYLDTSHFSLLTDVFKSSPNVFYNFVDKWREANYILTVSKTHIEEIMQLSFSETRNLRFKVLSEFIPFKYENENFFEREIFLNLFKNGLLPISDEDRKTNLSIFSRTISDKNELELVKQTHTAIRSSGLYKLTSFADGRAWKAKKMDKIHSSPKPKLKNVKNKFFFKIFAKFIGIDSSNLGTLRKTFESTLKDFLFKIQLQSTLKNSSFVTDKSVASNISKKISRSNCSGLWLRSEIETRLKLAQDFKPNNEKDLDHIQYLPYVDLFVTDRRIVEMTTQVLRSPGLPESLKKVASPIKVPQSLEALEKALFDTSYSDTNSFN